MSDRAAPDAGRRAPVVLAFDTAGSSCSVAVGFGLDVLAHERRDMRHGHAEALLPMVDRVVKAAGLRPAELDMVAVAVGPGGFTGARIAHLPEPIEDRLAHDLHRVRFFPRSTAKIERPSRAGTR